MGGSVGVCLPPKKKNTHRQHNHKHPINTPNTTTTTQNTPLPKNQRSPHHADVFLSASGDTSVRLWDLRQPAPTLLLPAHAFEVLCADWCKYSDCIIATGSIDKTVKIWDVRRPQRELATLIGHRCACVFL